MRHIIVYVMTCIGISLSACHAQVEYAHVDELLASTRKFESSYGGASIKTNSSGEVVEYVLYARYATDRNIRLLSQVRTLEHLEIQHHKNHLITDEGFKSITNITHLKSLKMCNALISKDKMETLAQLKQLENVSITYSVFDDDAFDGNIGGAAMNTIYIRTLKPLHWTVLSKLFKMQKINEIDINKIDVTGANISQIAPSNSQAYTNGPGQIWFSWKRKE